MKTSLLLGLVCLLWQPIQARTMLPVAQDPIVTRGPYLQLGTQMAVTIRWRTDQAITGRVTFRLSVGPFV